MVFRHLLSVLLLPGMVAGVVPAWVRHALAAHDTRWPEVGALTWTTRGSEPRAGARRVGARLMVCGAVCTRRAGHAGALGSHASARGGGAVPPCAQPDDHRSRVAARRTGAVGRFLDPGRLAGHRSSASTIPTSCCVEEPGLVAIASARPIASTRRTCRAGYPAERPGTAETDNPGATFHRLPGMRIDPCECSTCASSSSSR